MLQSEGQRDNEFIEQSMKVFAGTASCTDVGHLDHGNSAAGTQHATSQAVSNPSYELARRFHLPTLQMSTFDGDLGRYRCFRRAFYTNIVSKVSNEEEKLHYLYHTVNSF